MSADVDLLIADLKMKAEKLEGKLAAAFDGTSAPVLTAAPLSAGEIRLVLKARLGALVLLLERGNYAGAALLAIEVMNACEIHASAQRPRASVEPPR